MGCSSTSRAAIIILRAATGARCPRRPPTTTSYRSGSRFSAGLVRFAEKCSRRHNELVQGYAIARVRHLVMFKLTAFNRMYDRRHLSAITRATRIFVAVVVVLSTMTQHKYVPREHSPRWSARA